MHDEITPVSSPQATARRRTAPPGGRFGWMERPDGVRVRYAWWQPQGQPLGTQPKGTILILHGWREFIEKYFETIADLLDRGYAVATMDWRGQGLSTRPLKDRHKGHALSFDPNIEDTKALMALVQAELPGPYVLMAHSFGGHCALRFLHDVPGAVDRAVLLAPMIGIHLHFLPETIAHAVVRGALKIGAATRYAPAQTPYREKLRWMQASVLTSDPERFEDELAACQANPDLALGGVTYGWLASAFDSIDRLRAPGFAEAIATRVMVVLAGREQVVDNRQARRFVDRLPNAHLLEIGDARHEILKERDELRQKFFAVFDEFMAAS